MEHDYERIRRGAVADSAGKTRVTLWLDGDTLARYREVAAREGRGYQSAINDALRGEVLNCTRTCAPTAPFPTTRAGRG